MNERERIELLMKCYDLSPSQFADRTGVQRASVSHIISGRNKPSLEVMLKIYEAFPGVDMKWLMMGVGEAPTRQAAPETVVSAPQESLFTEQPVTPQAENTLFTAPAEPVRPVVEEPKPRRAAVQQPPLRDKVVAPEPRPRRSSQGSRLAQMATLQVEKKIKEIRIYYSDGTYETLIPEK